MARQSLEDQAKTICQILLDKDPVVREKVVLAFLEKADLWRREANAGYQLLKGSEVCMKAWKYIVDAVNCNISWGPQGTPETVAANFVFAMEEIANGKAKPLDFGDATGVKK